MTDIYSKIAEIVAKRQKAALCIITETRGSTPRKKGSKMIVYHDKSIFGTVGGGDLEFHIISQAVDVIEKKQAQTFDFGLATDFKMACGGAVSVYIEPIEIKDKLIIFGAGHIGSKLAEWGINFNFDVTVIDERKNIFDNWNKNINCINEEYKPAIDKLKFDASTYVCIITHKHSYDRQIAALVAPNELAYIGIIASTNKSKKISTLLFKEDKLKQEDIDKIEMPMGVPINCETPEEIVISILARLIDVKNFNTKNKH